MSLSHMEGASESERLLSPLLKLIGVNHRVQLFPLNLRGVATEGDDSDLPISPGPKYTRPVVFHLPNTGRRRYPFLYFVSGGRRKGEKVRAKRDVLN